MKSSILTLCMLCICLFPIYGQNDVKTQTYAIKKSADYLYGEAAGDDETACYEIAKEKLLTKISAFIQQQSDSASVDAYMINNIKSKTKKLTYARSIRIKVVCVYVEKKDIIPLYKTEVAEVESDTLVEIPVEISVEIPILQQNSDSVMRNIIADSSSVAALSLENMDYTKREKEVLAEVLSLKTYNDIYQYLNGEKNTHYDVRFKLVKHEDAAGCFWLIFDTSQKLVAAFDKQRIVNLLDVNGEKWTYYSRHPKMWIQIIE